MGESRLTEITREIVKADGFLSVALYVTSLSESDIRLLLNYLRSSKYKDMDYISGLVAFSRDYLKSKEISDECSLDSTQKKNSSK